MKVLLTDGWIDIDCDEEEKLTLKSAAWYILSKVVKQLVNGTCPLRGSQPHTAVRRMVWGELGQVMLLLFEVKTVTYGVYNIALLRPAKKLVRRSSFSLLWERTAQIRTNLLLIPRLFVGHSEVLLHLRMKSLSKPCVIVIGRSLRA